MFVLVVCARCRAARAVQAGQRSSECVRCARKLVVAETARGSFATLEEAQHAMGALHARLAGAPEAYAEAVSDLARAAPRDAHDDAPSRAAARARHARGETARAEAVARALSAAGSFDAREFAAALEKLGVPGERAAALLARLCASERVFAPSPGRFLVV